MRCGATLVLAGKMQPINKMQHKLLIWLRNFSANFSGSLSYTKPLHFLCSNIEIQTKPARRVVATQLARGRFRLSEFIGRLDSPSAPRRLSRRPLLSSAPFSRVASAISGPFARLPRSKNALAVKYPGSYLFHDTPHSFKAAVVGYTKTEWQFLSAGD